MTIYYLDTSIWMDYYFERSKNGEFAKKLIQNIVKKGRTIIYSDATIIEFKKNKLFESEINDMLRIAKPNNIKRIHPTKPQIIEAIKLAKQRKVPYRDALHAVLARDHNIQLVARDPHYLKIKDVAEAKKPEELI